MKTANEWVTWISWTGCYKTPFFCSHFLLLMIWIKGNRSGGHGWSCLIGKTVFILGFVVCITCSSDVNPLVSVDRWEGNVKENGGRSGKACCGCPWHSATPVKTGSENYVLITGTCRSDGCRSHLSYTKQWSSDVFCRLSHVKKEDYCYYPFAYMYAKSREPELKLDADDTSR